MSYPWEVEPFCECVRKISKYICVQINDVIENDVNGDCDNESEDELSSESEL